MSLPAQQASTFSLNVGSKPLRVKPRSISHSEVETSQTSQEPPGSPIDQPPNGLVKARVWQFSHSTDVKLVTPVKLEVDEVEALKELDDSYKDEMSQDGTLRVKPQPSTSKKIQDAHEILNESSQGILWSPLKINIPEDLEQITYFRSPKKPTKNAKKLKIDNDEVQASYRNCLDITIGFLLFFLIFAVVAAVIWLLY